MKDRLNKTRKGLWAIIAVLILSSCSQQQNWPQFRGPESNMVAASTHLPDSWGEGKNVKWTYKEEGAGWSSPIVFGNKVFIVSAVPEKITSKAAEDFGPPPQGKREGEDNHGADNDHKGGPPVNGNGPGPNPPSVQQSPMAGPPVDTTYKQDVYRWEVICLDKNSGKELWKNIAYKGNPSIGKNPQNTYASETPVTDGKRLYVYFGMTGLFCYDLDGKLLWKKNLGAYETQMGWGTGSSPVVFNDILYIQNDNEVSSYVLALDAANGTEKWKAAQNEKTTYTTPFIWKNKLRNELVTLGKAARSYDLINGKLLWELKIGGEQCVPSPVGDREHLYLGNAGGRESKGSLMSVKAGAEGDITPTAEAAANNWIEWSLPDAGLGNSSPLLYKGYIYCLGGRDGILTTITSETGKVVYRQKIGGVGAVWSSAWAHDDKISFFDEKGVTRTVKAGEKFEMLSENTLNDKFWASVAVTGDAYIFKGVEKIYFVKQ